MKLLTPTYFGCNTAMFSAHLGGCTDITTNPGMVLGCQLRSLRHIAQNRYDWQNLTLAALNVSIRGLAMTNWEFDNSV